MARKPVDPEFPCSLVIRTPFPTHRLASSALKALQVDAELSPLVRRSFTLLSSSNSSTSPKSTTNGTSSSGCSTGALNGAESQEAPSTLSGGGNNKTILVTEYKAKTNRMLRVAVNGFMESLGVVLGVMERLDVDTLPTANAAGTGAGAAAATSTALPATVGPVKN